MSTVAHMALGGNLGLLLIFWVLCVGAGADDVDYRCVGFGEVF